MTDPMTTYAAFEEIVNERLAKHRKEGGEMSLRKVIEDLGLAPDVIRALYAAEDARKASLAPPIPVVDKTEQIEREVIRLIAERAILHGFSVSIYNGAERLDDPEIKQSTDVDAILKAAQLTDGDSFYFYFYTRPPKKAKNNKPIFIGSISLVYGNGFDVISDHTDNAIIRAILADAEAYIEKEQA